MIAKLPFFIPVLDRSVIKCGGQTESAFPTSINNVICDTEHAAYFNNLEIARCLHPKVYWRQI